MQKKEVFVSAIKGFITGILSSFRYVTIATLILSFNSYNILMEGINNPKKNKKEMKYVCIPLIIGIIIGIISGTQVMNFITKEYRNHLILLLIGIIIGGIKTVIQKQKIKIDKMNIIISIIIILAGTALIYLTNNHSFDIKNKIVLIPVISVLIGASLLIPGLSVITTKITYQSILNSIVYIAISAVIIILAIKLMAKIVKTAYDKNQVLVYIILCSLMVINLIQLLFEIDKIKVDFVNIFTLLLVFLWGYIFAKNVEKE